jgi:hypothetical protein
VTHETRLTLTVQAWMKETATPNAQRIETIRKTGTTPWRGLSVRSATAELPRTVSTPRPSLLVQNPTVTIRVLAEAANLSASTRMMPAT